MFSSTALRSHLTAAVAAATLLSLAPVTSAQQCCFPWDNGPYDGTGAQTSQTGFDLDWKRFGRVTFDDFWLCESSVYHVQQLRGTLCTDSIVPKVSVVIVRDCDGRPDLSEAGLIAVADSVPVDTTDLPLGAECRTGTVTITETGGMTAEGFRIIEATATFPKLWLDGGAYWVAFIGYSGTANPLEQFFWGYAGNHTVKGRPGVFFDSDDGSITDVDQLCCGCTDFAFCLEAEECKILLDNGGPDITRYAPSYGYPGSTFRESRAADDAVIAKCEDRRLCFVEGYLLTNCDPPRARLDIYDNACKLPATFAPPATFPAQCIHDTGLALATPTGPLKLYKVQFWDLRAIDGSPFILQRDKNYWFSIYGLGTGAQSERAYFVASQRCDRTCPGTISHFNQAAVSGRGVGRTDASWIPVSEFSGQAYDLAFRIATDEVLPAFVRGGVTDPSSPACPADIDGNGDATLQDLFTFLNAWFQGCP